MTTLHSFDDETFSDLAFTCADTITSGLLYFLSRGRNAWHSTWINNYWNGCMHAELISAKSAAERQRKQGSVFYIYEQPALLIRNCFGVIAIVEINSERPLARYPSKEMHKYISASRYFDTYDIKYLMTNDTLVNAFTIINNSQYYSQTNNIIAVAIEDAAVKFDKIPKRELKKYVSHPSSHADLHWRGAPLTIDARPVERIVKSIRAKLRKREPANSLLKIQGIEDPEGC